MEKNIQPVRWGILGTSRFALKKSIPRMSQADHVEIVAIASREIAAARNASEQLCIGRAYGSYEELLDDPDVEAIYIPLPNHLHAQWTAKAARAGKHVLCEKPISLNSSEAGELASVQRETGVLIAEAFMIRAHPQWKTTKSLVTEGRVGTMRLIQATFTYHNTDSSNIRNREDTGGGALLDIGCYLVNIARWLFEGEPQAVMSMAQWDPAFRTDRLTSVILEFAAGHAIFTCGTQAVPFERVEVLGTSGRIEIEIPFKAPPDHACSPELDFGNDVYGSGSEIVVCAPADQFLLQAEEFSMAIRTGSVPQNHIGEAVCNMRVIDAIFRSIRSGRAETP